MFTRFCCYPGIDSRAPHGDGSARGFIELTAQHYRLTGDGQSLSGALALQAGPRVREAESAGETRNRSNSSSNARALCGITDAGRGHLLRAVTGSVDNRPPGPDNQLQTPGYRGPGPRLSGTPGSRFGTPYSRSRPPGPCPQLRGSRR
ncbi:unnamed protein product [Lota lota]